jgi:hypothetical protein
MHFATTLYTPKIHRTLNLGVIVLSRYIMDYLDFPLKRLLRVD